MATAEKTVRLGAEYDDRLRSALLHVLRGLGATTRGNDYGVGGSQELERLDAEIHGRRIVVEAETYIGLSITGPADLVDRVHALVQECMEKPI